MESDSEYNPVFLLSKWYLDGIDKAGNVALGYAARLNWHKLHVNYSGLLTTAETEVRAVNTFRSRGTPNFHDRTTEWISDKLQLRGIWYSIDAPIASRLIDSNIGKLHWHCFQPKARVSLSVAGKPLLQSGIGYVEKLEMTFKPWELPFNEIRWGRYLSDSETVVWIWWIGESHQNMCFYNGKILEKAGITDQGIGLPGDMGRIVFSDSLTLRSGRSLADILNAVPVLRDKLPQKITNLFECKWRSRGIRIVNGNVIGEGWIIHEVVKW
ncbi:MAG TPA: hypothetical protein VKA08_10625 [Balneolales bacterium]|nr:hypothetical protein [Balneolales bacterium]